MVFQFAHAKQNEKFTEIKPGPFSWRLFTRLIPARSLCSSLFARVTQRRAGLRSKRFRGIGVQRKTEERGFRCFARRRERWGESQNKEEGGGGGNSLGHVSV